jgi:hypothetical protein
MTGHGVWRLTGWALGCVVLLLSVASCARRPKDERVDVKTALLPEAAADEKSFSGYQPAKPYAAAGNNLVGRTIFQADAAAGYRVEVRDWKVPPGKQTDSITLPGAAFIEVRSGAGSLAAGEKKQELQLGTIASISQEQPFTIANNGPAPLSLRMYVVLTP